MAFVMRIEDIDGVVLFDFLDSTFLEAVSTEQRVTSDGDGNLIEDMLIISRNSDSSAARSGARTLSDISEKVARWFEIKTEFRSIWWVMNTNGETEKRALIGSMTIEYENINNNPSSYLTQEKGAYRTVITHSELFEEKATVNVTGGLQVINERGGKFDMTTAVATNTDSRVSEMRISNAGSSDPNLNIFWAGMLPYLDSGTGSRDFFDPVLSNVDRTDLSDDSSSTTFPFDDRTGVIYTTFDGVAGVAMSPKVSYGFNLPDSSGRFHILMLSYVSCQSCVQGKIGVMASSTHSSPLTVENISRTLTDISYIPAVRSTKSLEFNQWHFNDLGVLQFPPNDYRELISDEGNVANLTIWMNNISGNANVYIDSIVLIPEEHFINWHTPVDEDGGGELSFMTMLTNEDYTKLGIIKSSTNPSINIDDASTPNSNNWEFPKNGGVFVACGGSDEFGDGRVQAGGTFVDMVINSIRVFPTWRLYAGESP